MVCASCINNWIVYRKGLPYNFFDRSAHTNCDDWIENRPKFKLFKHQKLQYPMELKQIVKTLVFG